MKNSLLNELPVPFKLEKDVLWMEAQAFNGITQWLENFEQMTVCAPIIPSHLIDPSISWKKVDDLPCRDRLAVVPLPWGYHPKEHYLNRKKVAQMFAEQIPKHQYLLFANLGWLGAWGNVGAHQAQLSKRPYAVWLDWVLHEMPQRSTNSLFKSGWVKLSRFMLKRESLSVIRRATLGLFHGRSVYEGYAPYCGNPQVVHDIHLKAEDVIALDGLQKRLLANQSQPLRIVYVGRVNAMKGPLDWIEIVEKLHTTNPERTILAKWMGDGPLLDACRQAVVQKGLEGVVEFPGSESDRGKVLTFLRSADVFLQCHLTPESPRCLIEALMSGLPIVGYESAYARDLVAHVPQAGWFSPLREIGAVVQSLENLSANRQRLASMTYAARECGTHFSDAAVFAHRSQLIKKYL